MVEWPNVACDVPPVLSTAARTPFDIVKQQMQTYAMGQRRKLSLPSAIRRVVHANGWWSSPSVVRLE